MAMLLIMQVTLSVNDICYGIGYAIGYGVGYDLRFDLFTIFNGLFIMVYLNQN